MIIGPEGPRASEFGESPRASGFCGSCDKLRIMVSGIIITLILANTTRTVAMKKM